MKHLNSQRLARIGSFSIAGCIVFAAAISSSGCGDSESRMTGVGVGEASSSVRPSGWSLEDLPASLDLTAEQSIEMRNAITRLNADLQRSHGKPWRAGGSAARTRGIDESPMLTFLESSSQTLGTDQFLILCDHLASQRARMHHQRDGRPDRHRAESMRSDRSKSWRSHRAESMDSDRAASVRPEGRRGHRDQGRFSRAYAELGLSSTQVRQLHEVRREYRRQVGALFAAVTSGALAADAGVAQATQLASSLKADLSDFLTPDQVSKLGELRSGRAHHRIDRRLETLEARTTRRAEFLAGVLQLTGDQPRQVEQILSGSIPDMRRNLEGVRDGTIDSQIAALKGVELERRALADVRSILNEDQLRKLDAIRDLVPLGTNAPTPRGHANR